MTANSAAHADARPVPCIIDRRCSRAGGCEHSAHKRRDQSVAVCEVSPQGKAPFAPTSRKTGRRATGFAAVILALVFFVLPPLAPAAQQVGKVWRIGSLHPSPAAATAPLVAAFEKGLAERG